MRNSAEKFKMKISNEDGDMYGRRKLTEISNLEFFEYAHSLRHDFRADAITGK